MSERANGCGEKVRRDNIIQLRMPLPTTTSTGKITNRGEAILEVELDDEDRVSAASTATGAAPPRVVSSGGG